MKYNYKYKWYEKYNSHKPLQANFLLNVYVQNKWVNIWKPRLNISILYSVDLFSNWVFPILTKEGNVLFNNALNTF